MTDSEKDNVIAELKKLTDDYVAALKSVLEKNELVYAAEYKYKIGGIPFDGIMPKIDNDAIEDLFLDLVNHPNCVQYAIHEKSYIEQKINEYEDYMSPKSRILRHIAEIERLKEKYHVTDDDLKKENLKL